MNKLFNASLFLFLTTFAATNALAKTSWVTIGTDAAHFSKGHFQKGLKIFKSNDEITVMEVSDDQLDHLSHEMHHEFNRCGGYIYHESLDEALNEFDNSKNRLTAAKGIFADYSIDQGDLVRPLVASVDQSNIKEVIEKLSSYKNRYYKSPTGVQSQHYVKEKWASLTAARKDAKVELYEHRSWDQPSVILTIEGSTSPDEIIVIGGHGDSIAGFWGGANAKAPGADDNASGIATITEIIRVLVQGNFKPTKTLKFMSYAAEEVGLRGSKEIAQSFKAQGKRVVGVMQLDMTNFQGSDIDINMMTDYTNADQNAFIGNIIDEYLTGVSWGYDKCGYACSDHASWTNAGFPASMPFEAKKRDMNRNIHTSRDTISISRNSASHAAKFAKMAVAFTIELDR